MQHNQAIFGEGIYTPRQAARLIASTPQEILRWTRGSGPTDPLWNARYQDLEDTTELSFSDLVEVRVVKAFRNAGSSLQSIRYAIELAKDKFGVDHPLSTLEFKTDGTQILMKSLENDGDFYSLHKNNAGQKVFAKIIDQSIKDLEYDDGHAARWRPHKSNEIVIDPKRQFGAPILDGFGISTKMIFEDNKLGHKINYLSAIYELPKAIIKHAIDYEESLETALAEVNGKSTL